MKPTPTFPMQLTAEFTLADRRLVMHSNGAVFQMQLAPEAAEWVWQDLLGGGDRRAERSIPEAKAWVTEKGLSIQIGTLPIFRTMNSTKRGILVDKKQMVNSGQAPAMWKVVQL